MTQEFKDQLVAKDQELIQQEGALKTEIEAKEAEIQRLTQELNAEKANTLASVNELNESKKVYQEQINQLDLQIAALQGENEKLKDRIVAATGAIVEAANNLEALMNSEPNADSQSAINDVFNEIEQSLQAITNSMQGNGPAPLPLAPLPLAPLPPPPGAPVRGARLPGNTSVNFSGSNFTLDNLILQLDAKAKQQLGNPGNKYAVALQQVRNAADVSDIDEILNAANIMTTKNGLIKGGRKTKKSRKTRKTKKIRKNMKQKGGFVYKSKKRHSLSTSSRRTTSER